MDSLGGRLRVARERLAKTQAELAQETGVMEATISRIENNRLEARPRLSTVRKLAAALCVEPGWLLFGDDEGKSLAA